MKWSLRFRLNAWIFVVLLGLLFIEILIVYPTRLEKPEPEFLGAPEPVIFGPQPEPTPVFGTEHMGGVHLFESKQGQRDWELFAKSADGAEGQGTWELKDVKVLFYSEDALKFTVTGDTGKINQKTKDLSIEGHVITTSPSGYRFLTELMTYDDAQRLLVSPQHVKMIGPKDSEHHNIMLTGDHMQTRVNQELMSIIGHVNATREMSDGRVVNIRSEEAQFWNNSKRAVFTGRVEMELENMKAEGPNATFEYDTASEFLSRVLMTGGVRLSDPLRYATSQKLEFIPSKDQFTLDGKPHLVQGDNEINGNQILLMDGGKRVKVENIKAKIEKE